MRGLFTFIILFLLSSSCVDQRIKGTFLASRKPITKTVELEKYPVPAGTIKFSDNFFIDKTEVTNISYLEFLSWTSLHYGENSNEYKSIFPDTLVWKELPDVYHILSTYYLTHPAYREFPVVGISKDQALKFSKWRSDRVMEFILISAGEFQFKQPRPKDSIFTIEKYFRGEFYGLKPNPYIKYYPEYSLSDTADFSRVVTFAEILNRKNIKSCSKKYCANEILKINCASRKDSLMERYPYGIDPLKSTSCSRCKKDLITHLIGNVRELTSKDSLTFGGSFKDQCTSTKSVYIKEAKNVNAYTGFRNICRWQKWL